MSPSMRTAILAVVLLIAVPLLVMAIVPTSFSSGGTSQQTPVALASPVLTVPSGIFNGFQGSCNRNSADAVQPASLINVAAAGTGASATYNPEQLDNNTAVNATVIAPSPSSLSNDQIILVGVGDPIDATTFTAVGIAATVQEYIISVTAPVAYLPNGTLVYSTSNTVSSGSTQMIEINHVHGWWWTYTYNGNSITGSDAWENGTYNLGVSEAAGHICEAGYTVGPSFVALAYGEDGAATPKIPTLSVPWAIGVEPNGGSSTSYVPAAANVIPQFNASLGTVGIQSHAQSASLGIDHLSVGSSVAYPGQFVPLWGNFKVVTLNSSTLTPSTADLAYAGSQIFNTTSLDQNGAPLAGTSFSWAVTPSSIGTLNATTGPSVKFTAASTTLTGTLWMNASYNCSTIHDVAALVVTPTGGPAIDNFTASPVSFVVGGTTHLNVSAGPWPRAISYAYTGLPAGCSTSNTSSLSCTPTAIGTYTAKVFLNDSLGHSSSATTSFTVDAALAITAFTASPAALTIATSTEIKVTATGGVTPLTYFYSGMPTGCSSGYQPGNFSCTPNGTGTFTPTVVVNDTAGHSVSHTTTIIVNKQLAATGFTASPSTILLGGSSYFNISVTGGTTPYSFVFHDLPTGCVTANTSQLKCTPTVTGTFVVLVNVTDASGAKTYSITTPGLTVNVPPLPEISSFYASPNPSNVSQPATLHVTAEGGVGALTYAYTGLPTGCTSSNTSSLACTPSVGGSFTVTVTVTDTKENKATQTITWTVVQVTPLISSFAADPASLTLGASTTFTVAATGGVGPLTYTYTGLPAGCTSTNATTLTCTPNATGSYSVQVFVNDSAGHSASAAAALSVASSSSTSGGLLSGSLLPLLLIAIVVIVAVVVLLLVLRRRRSQPPTAPQGWSPSGPNAPITPGPDPAAYGGTPPTPPS